ncbi:hypothetical protein GAW90_003227, partial [Vibrio cholerae]
MNNSYESYNESFEPRRGKVNIEIDALVQRDGAIYRIVQILDFESVIAVDVETGRTVPLRIGELRNIQESISTHSHSETLQDLSDIADEDWQVAQKRYAAIRPLIGQLYIGREGA